MIVGWSMGVQVALEFASLYSDRVAGLILINGTYGFALETAFQPLFRVPWLANVLRALLEFTLQHRPVMDAAARIGRSRPVTSIFGHSLALLRGKPEIRDMLCQYSTDVFGPSFENFLRLFQEIDAHSVIHHLRELPHKTLVISGGLDMMTPSYQARQITRKMPNARHVHFPWASHFVIIEYTSQVIPSSASSSAKWNAEAAAGIIHLES